MIHGPIILTSDAAGAAIYTSPQYLEGLLQCIYIDYDPLAAAGTDVVVYDETQPVPAAGGITYLTVTNNNVDGAYFPRIDCCDNAGVAVFYDPLGVATTEVRDHYCMANPITITLAAIGAAGRTITVWIYYSEFR